MVIGLHSTITNEEGKFTLQDLSINSNQEVYAVATYNGYSSENSSIGLVTEVPAISITRISPEGVISGYATEGSHFIEKIRMEIFYKNLILMYLIALVLHHLV